MPLDKLAGRERQVGATREVHVFICRLSCARDFLHKPNTYIRNMACVSTLQSMFKNTEYRYKPEERAAERSAQLSVKKQCSCHHDSVPSSDFARPFSFVVLSLRDENDVVRFQAGPTRERRKGNESRGVNDRAAVRCCLSTPLSQNSPTDKAY